MHASKHGILPNSGPLLEKPQNLPFPRNEDLKSGSRPCEDRCVFGHLPCACHTGLSPPGWQEKASGLGESLASHGVGLRAVPGDTTARHPDTSSFLGPATDGTVPPESRGEALTPGVGVLGDSVL